MNRRTDQNSKKYINSNVGHEIIKYFHISMIIWTRNSPNIISLVLSLTQSVQKERFRVSSPLGVFYHQINRYYFQIVRLCSHLAAYYMHAFFLLATISFACSLLWKYSRLLLHVSENSLLPELSNWDNSFLLYWHPAGKNTIVKTKHRWYSRYSLPLSYF